MTTTTYQTATFFPVSANSRSKLRILLALFLGALLIPVTVHAQGTDPNTIAQNIQTFMTGPWGKSVASVAFGCVGLVAWWGYMSWSTAAKTVLGGVCLFSAPWFVTTFFGQ